MADNAPPTPEAPGDRAERLTDEQIAGMAKHLAIFNPLFVGSLAWSEQEALVAEVQRLREMERQVRALRRHQSSIFYMNGGGDDSYSEMTWVVKVSDLDAALGDTK